MRRYAALAAGLLALSAGTAAASDVSEHGPDRYDWPHYGGQSDEAGHAALGQIHRGNVERLGLV